MLALIQQTRTPHCRDQRCMCVFADDANRTMKHVVQAQALESVLGRPVYNLEQLQHGWDGGACNRSKRGYPPPPRDDATSREVKGRKRDPWSGGGNGRAKRPDVTPGFAA